MNADSQTAMNTFLGIGAAVVFMALLFLIRRESSRKAETAEATFAGRESLLPEQFYERYFRESGVSFDIVTGVRAILEEALDADLSRLANTDDFSKNLSFFWDFDSMADVEIICSLEKRFAIAITGEEAESTKTVNDIIGLVHRKTGAPHVD